MRTRLLALSLLLLVPAFFLMLRSNWKRQRSEKALAIERAVTTAKLIAASETYFIREARQQLATMTQFPLALSQDFPLTERGLKSLRRLQPDFTDFGLVETNGTVFCHTLGSNVTATVNQMLVERVLASRDFTASVFPWQNRLALQFGYPVLRNGDAVRVMYATLQPHLLSDVLTNITLTEGGVVTVFTAAGQVLARRSYLDDEDGIPAEILFQEAREQPEGAFETTTPDGAERLCAVSVVKDRDHPVLFVTVEAPREEIFASADGKFVGNSIVALVAVSLLLATASLYSDRVFVRPINTIVAAADRISSGDLKARTGLRKGRNELHRLAERFDQMAASLDKRQSELEQANQEIKSANLELERRVAERTRELESLNHELEAFSYSVSHDLRAPLRHMQGFAQMLLRNPRLQDDANVQRQLGIIVDAAKQMGALIDDLLTLSRTGRQAVTITEVDMARLVREVAAEAGEAEPDRNIEWHIEPLPTVLGDAPLLRQVWVNLIGNAVKYTRGRNPAHIMVSGHENGEEIEFSIRDNGAGFDMAYANKLFGVFQRLHQSDEFEGTGIGLANVRRIIARHGGRTWAEGRVGEGATFSFSLPKRPA